MGEKQLPEKRHKYSTKTKAMCVVCFLSPYRLTADIWPQRYSAEKKHCKNTEAFFPENAVWHQCNTDTDVAELSLSVK